MNTTSNFLKSSRGFSHKLPIPITSFCAFLLKSIRNILLCKTWNSIKFIVKNTPVSSHDKEEKHVVGHC